MRVVVEGPDGAGKTRFIERLMAHTNTLELAPRASDSAKGPVPDLSGYIEDDLLNHGGRHRLYDRHPLISERVYGPVIRGQMQFNDRGIDWLTEMLSMFYNYNPLVIYCLPPWHAVYHNVQRGVQMSGVTVNIRKIYQLYVSTYCMDAAAGHQAVVWDYTRPVNFSRIIRHIEVGVGDDLR